MSLFNFFRRSKTTVSNPSADTSVLEPVIAVDRSLFVDDEAPDPKNSVNKEANHIEEFMGKNYEWQGYNDGYSHPDAEYLQHSLAKLRSEFRLSVDKCMDEKRSELGSLKLHLIDTEGISPRLEAKLKEKIRQIEVVIHELDTQKILSIEAEGIIAPAIHGYRLGFIKGLESYQQEKLFAGSTGLFNQ
ncbi:MAG: hypothetical protein IPG86_09590 [Chitinophagaceae bacterium]|nr:hypothetical protein [Chitinophagaceae bacterium]